MPAAVCPHCGTVWDADGRREVECPACAARVSDDSTELLVGDAKSECYTAASGLMVIGMVTMVVGLGVLIQSLYHPGDWGLGATGYAAYSVLIGGFWVYAGTQMREAKQYAVCLVACVTLLPTLSPCCIFGGIFGVMGIAKLTNPRVRKGFAANRPGYDPDVPE